MSAESAGRPRRVAFLGRRKASTPRKEDNRPHFPQAGSSRACGLLGRLAREVGRTLAPGRTRRPNGAAPSRGGQCSDAWHLLQLSPQTSILARRPRSPEICGGARAWAAGGTRTHSAEVPICSRAVTEFWRPRPSETTSHLPNHLLGCLDHLPRSVYVRVPLRPWRPWLGFRRGGEAGHQAKALVRVFNPCDGAPGARRLARGTIPPHLSRRSPAEILIGPNQGGRGR
jgi:hypothetical protein